MSPREINVHIEELVLHGFAGKTRWDIAEALEHELRGLLVTHGIPPAWQASPEKLDTTPIQAAVQTKPAATGEQIARVVYRGGAR